MPRKWRPGKARRSFNRPFLPTVEHYLRTGEIALQPGDNPFVTLSLYSQAARDLRAAWEAGDTDAIGEALGRIPGNVFV